ncbi:MAG: response regulator [Calditrichales bacterium]|nr:response regulator [Calditrichales bacterium]
MKKRIFVIEDDESTAELIRFYFEEEGYEVQTCLTGRNFKQLVYDFKPHLITLDILLPDADGLDILKDLLKDESTCNIPVILISVKESERKKGLSLGAVSFISKPLDQNSLKQIVKNILKL